MTVNAGCFRKDINLDFIRMAMLHGVVTTIYALEKSLRVCAIAGIESYIHSNCPNCRALEVVCDEI